MGAEFSDDPLLGAYTVDETATHREQLCTLYLHSGRRTKKTIQKLSNRATHLSLLIGYLLYCSVQLGHEF